MHLEYSKQLEAKKEKVADALRTIGKLLDPMVFPCQPCATPFAYRNKMQLPVRNGKMGLFARKSHSLVEIEGCVIHSSLGEEALRVASNILSAHSSLDHLHYILLKTAIRTQQVLIILVTGETAFPQHIACEMLSALPQIKGVVQNRQLSKSNTILGPEFHLLAGQDWIEEELGGFLFKISPSSFFQVNPPMAEMLYKKVIEGAALDGKQRVLDAYCGIGTLSLLLAQKASYVLGIESVDQAIQDAKHNAIRNGVSQAQFLCGKVEEEIRLQGHFDVAILNPPRKGCEVSVLDHLANQRIPTIIYVSCDPATLARDVHFLVQKGYRLDWAHPFDMFPQTFHVETVARLTRYSP